jgi:hypothetical protein
MQLFAVCGKYATPPFNKLYVAVADVTIASSFTKFPTIGVRPT